MRRKFEVEDIMDKDTRPISFRELELIILRAISTIGTDVKEGDVPEFILQEHFRRNLFDITNTSKFESGYAKASVIDATKIDKVWHVIFNNEYFGSADVIFPLNAEGTHLITDVSRIIFNSKETNVYTIIPIGDKTLDESVFKPGNEWGIISAGDISKNQ